MENQQSEAQQPEMPTPEQIALREAQRTAMIAFYKKDIPSMKIEAEYNELQERIEKARYNTWQWRIRFDQMMAPPPKTGEEGQEKIDQGIDKLSSEQNNLVKAAADTIEKGNVIPLNGTAKTEESKN